ncbi:MAG: TetR/AcrR family transcriptional regulator [Ardenticatenaceae bacterium]|nr:TetR/AcrR family transcriptional regulator [Ardenticatenaceae bacterium]
MSFAKPFEHQDALFQAAVEEFSTAGYEQASINTILKKAGMSKGQFYYHFQNKQGLYFALIEIFIASKQAYLAEVMRPDDFATDIFTILKTQVHHGFAFAQAQPNIYAFSQSFLKEKGNPIYEAALARFNFDNDAGLGRLIEEAHRRGEFHEDLPLEFVRRTITYLFNHVTDLTDLGDEKAAEENLNRLIKFMKNGLARRESGLTD